MQSAETVLGVLRERGRRGLPCDELYRQLFNPQLYLLAYGRIYANKGAMTPGVTGETVDGMSLGKIERIIDALRHERYRFSPAKRIYIPKKNGKLRPLGLPPWSDKLVGEVVRLLLEATGWIIRPAGERTEDEQRGLARILERCDSLRAVDRLVSDFAGMLRQRQGQHLDTWITQAKHSGVAQLAGFTAGLIKDYDAVRNGLTLPYISGAVEGNVCRLKAIKRQMYGRANFDLLRLRVVLAE
jgi:hypothetical protein